MDSTCEITVWEKIYKEVVEFTKTEPTLVSFLHETVLCHSNFEESLSFNLANKLHSPTLRGIHLHELIMRCLTNDKCVGHHAQKDLEAIVDRDPAAGSYAIPFLYYKGFHAIQCYRVAHWLWLQDRKILAYHIQNRMSEVFAVDIHPAAKIASGIFIDHATSVVIGETAVIEDNVSILHEVTLGGTGKDTGDRHPKVRQGVLIGAGAKILGNIEIGRGAKIGAGSVVLKNVPEHITVAGVPARIVGRTLVDCPALEMNHSLMNNNLPFETLEYFI